MKSINPAIGTLELRTNSIRAGALAPGDIVLLEAVDGHVFGQVKMVDVSGPSHVTVVFGYGDGDGSTTRHNVSIERAYQYLRLR